MPEFKPGFRLSILDAAILAAGVAVACVGPRDLAIVATSAVFHFFLFCNVFRIRRVPELVWAGIFVILSSATIATGWPTWGITLAVSSGIAALIIWRELKIPSYHGLLWQKFNPALTEWWKQKYGK
ncbi:MAG TPA: hypothetical protein VF585_03040 [Chthoniobacterales bacterium]|jgi:hypothetical protein